MRSGLPVLPRPSWSAVLRLGADGGALDKARAIQVRELAAARPTALFLNLFAFAVVGCALSGLVPPALLGGWLAVATGVIAIAGWDQHRHRDAPVQRALLLKSTISATTIALLWFVALAAFSAWCGPSERLMLAVCGTSLMAGGALILAAAPLASFVYIGCVGIGLSALLTRSGGPELGGIGLMVTIVTWFLALRNARLLTLRRGIEVSLAEQEAIVSLLLREHEDSADWLWQVDGSRILTSVSPRFAQRIGRPVEALVGRPLLELLAGNDWDSGKVAQPVRELAEKLRLREPVGALAVPVRLDGETRWWTLSATPRHDQRGRFIGHWGVGSDITEQRRSAERIDHMARFDALTGLANRRQVMESLAEALVAAHRSRGRAALVILDLDRFKQVNDTLGHPVGDRLLKEVSRRLLELAGDYALCGRLGGDEFAMVVPDASDAGRLDRLAEAVIAGLSAPYDIDEYRLFIGASLGSATSPRDGRSGETLVRNADLALYRAKDDGRGVHRRYEQRLSARAEERLGIEIALRDALERGEFSLVYQPIVAAGTACVAGFEGLLRWTNPVLGDVPPERFVPIAEEARLMTRIGEWAIRTACAEAARWPAPTRIALNLSTDQLRDPQLPATLVSALSASGLAPERLELEVDEAVFLRPGDDMAATIERLAAIGVRVTLTGFGTGYASLGYLRTARFSSIKLDRSFIAGAARNMADSVAIIRAVVAMADGLGMTVTAEGTETERHYDMLRQLGCGQAQGWLFGHPVPPAEARTLAGATAARKAA